MTSLYKNVSLQLKKIISCEHPIKDIAKNLISPELQRRHGVIVNLFSKSIGISNSLLMKESAGIIPQVTKMQEKLSEITDMMYASHILHQGVLNFEHSSADDKNEETHTGNCLSILIGDQLLATASRGLAELRNPCVVEWMSLALEDFSKFSFLVEENVDYSQPECIMKSIEDRCRLSGGSLLAHSCKSAALLAGYSQTENKSFLKEAFDIGNNIGISFQLQDMLASNANKVITPQKLPKEEVVNYLKKVLEVNVTSCLHLVEKLPKCESTVKIRNLIVSIANKYIHQCLIDNRNLYGVIS